MYEYDWEAMAAAWERKHVLPFSLADLLRRTYEQGVRHGSGWGGEEELEAIGMAIRASQTGSKADDE